MNNKAKMCDCNQGRLPCTCNLKPNARGDGQAMTIYWKCSKCNHQLEFTGGTYKQVRCPKCGDEYADMSIGEKPIWWKS